ncbi:MAG: pilus assembly protein [Anaerolineae bacterium]|nr:pilus assembly protein [Anaerolineae bacterium]
MYNVPRKILRILDGTPAVYGQHTRGQSVVELALVTPLLIILLMGLAEIGWFANNYMILLETTRVGARYGAIQTGDTSPLAWPAEGSLIPGLLTSATDQANSLKFRNCANLTALPETRRFYNTLVCRMFDAMSPLPYDGGAPVDADPLNLSNGVDDIVVSAFALQTINPQDANIPAAMRSTIDLISGYPTDQQQVIVIGRYPTNANECTTETGAERDPFNYISYTGAGYTNGTRNYVVPSGTDVEENRLYYEYPGDDSGSERQRGFAFSGQHVIGSTRGLATNLQCYGSEWNIDRIERLMNVTGFTFLNNATVNKAQRAALPSEGLVLVEMFWQHSLLLRNPVFNPVFNILNDPSNPNNGGTIISVWAAFPLPTVEARIKYAVEN